MRHDPEESSAIPNAGKNLGKDLSEAHTAQPKAIDDVRTQGVDEVGLLTENRQPDRKSPTGGQ
jgi:hypothetical protein